MLNLERTFAFHYSNNFVLQAASRCLRQTSGNRINAKIYLSKENVSVLDEQLRGTYGETLLTLGSAKPMMVNEKLVVRKPKIPPILLKTKVRRIVPADSLNSSIKFNEPKVLPQKLSETYYEIKEIPTSKNLLREVRKEEVCWSLAS